jgi:hypothetical protein
MAHDFGIHILILPYPLPRATSLSVFKIFYLYFLNSFCKNIRPFQNLSVLTTNRRGARRPQWATSFGGLTAVRHGGRTKRREPMAIAVLQMTCATAAGSLRLKTALKIIEINRKNYF